MRKIQQIIYKLETIIEDCFIDMGEKTISKGVASYLNNQGLLNKYFAELVNLYTERQEYLTDIEKRTYQEFLESYTLAKDKLSLAKRFLLDSFGHPDIENYKKDWGRGMGVYMSW